MKYCLNCNQDITEKRKSAKYCSNACKQRAYEKRKNVIPFEFVNKIKANKKKRIDNIQNVSYEPIHSELKMAKINKNYWFEIHKKAIKGIFPVSTLIGLSIGLLSNKKIINASLGAVIGQAFDQKRKERIIKEAYQNHLHFSELYNRLKKAKGLTTKLIDEKKLISYQNKLKLPENVINSKTYKREIIPFIKFNEKYNYLLGNPSSNFYMLVHGLPGQGKTTFSIQFAQYFNSKHGKTIYLASEQQGLNKPLQSLLKRFNTTFDVHLKPNLLTLDTAIEIIKDYKAVVIDSINHIGWSADQIETIRENCPNTAFIGVLQSKKDGDFKGSQEFAHNSDVLIEIKNMEAHQYKSRFAKPAHVIIDN